MSDLQTHELMALIIETKQEKKTVKEIDKTERIMNGFIAVSLQDPGLPYLPLHTPSPAPYI